MQNRIGASVKAKGRNPAKVTARGGRLTDPYAV